MSGASPLRRRAAVAVTVLIAVLAAGAGWSAGRLASSPTEASRVVPEASPITVPVGLRLIESTLVVRGEARHAEALALQVGADLGVDTTDSLLVTGRIPDEHSELAEGDVALEISGRPVLLLEGSLPMFRTLRPGHSGEDVAQLEQALARLGYLDRPAADTYDRATAAAITDLYEAAGYRAVGPSEEQQQRLAGADSELAAAEAAHQQAEAALAEAAQPPPRSAVLAAEGAVVEAQFAYDQAQTALERAAESGDDDQTIAELEAQLIAAGNRLAVAEAQLEELIETPDTSPETEALARARDALDAAEDQHARLAETSGVRAPRGELRFVPSLPRRVDSVNVALGDEPASPVMNLTGSELRVAAPVSPEQAQLVEPGQQVRLDDEASGVDITGTVVSVAESTLDAEDADPNGHRVMIQPQVADPAELSGLNLRVTIPIESTDGEVLAVPLAALVTDPAGTTTVRVAHDQRYQDVAVRVGLAADGFVAVTPVDAELTAGDLVVVGSQR